MVGETNDALDSDADLFQACGRYYMLLKNRVKTRIGFSSGVSG
jgi:hypothetical protein